MLFICWKYLTERAFSFTQTTFPGGRQEIGRLLKSLGKISYAENVVLIVFVITALCWITRSFVLTPLLAKFGITGLDDTIIAMIAGISLFLLPANKERSRPILNWEEAVKLVNFLTEITSNLATTAMILPILAPLALELNVHPYLLMVGATIGASCAFMLPVATPPNAVVFGSGYLTIPDMLKTGVWLNIISILLITALVYFLLPLLWGFETGMYPPGWD